MKTGIYTVRENHMIGGCALNHRSQKGPCAWETSVHKMWDICAQWLCTVHDSFDSKFIREAVSLNIIPLAQLSNSMREKFGLQTPHASQSDADISADINFLDQAYVKDGHYLYMPGWTQVSIDAIACGLSKLQGGALQSFLEKYVSIL